jgi:hypothetical protein
MAENKSWFARIKERLQGGSEHHITRYTERAVAHGNKQVALLEEANAKLKEHIKDESERLDDVINNVDVDKIKDIDGCNQQVLETYRTIAEINATIKGYEDKISDNEHQIGTYKFILDKLK